MNHHNNTENRGFSIFSQNMFVTRITIKITLNYIFYICLSLMSKILLLVVW